MSETHPPAQSDESASAGLAIAQFVVTAVLLGLVATLAYLAGMRSAGKESGGGSNASGPAANVDVATLLKPSPDLVTKGKSLFAVNCASCHGPEGFGNGPASSALNPKPRNFHETYMRYGGGVARIVQTISTGSPGTAMAAFANIPLEDRFALAHYVRTFMPKPPEDKPEDLAWLGPIGGTGGGGGGTGAHLGGPAKPTPSIPIELALKLIQEPSPAGTLPGMVVAAPPSDAPGATLYGQRCASCHGGSGEGGVRVRMLGSSPYAYVTTQSFSASRSAGDPAAFEKLVLQGIPGYVMPGSGDLSKDEIRQLYEFTSGLRSKQPQATPAAAPAASAAPHATTRASQGGTRS